jgi:hypothetical protein
VGGNSESCGVKFDYIPVCPFYQPGVLPKKYFCYALDYRVFQEQSFMLFLRRSLPGEVNCIQVKLFGGVKNEFMSQTPRPIFAAKLLMRSRSDG